MKKIMCLALALILCLSFTACSGPNAEMTEENITETVEVAETALKEFDTKKLEKYVDSSTLKIIISYAENHDQFKELGEAIFANLSLTINNIDTENGTVTLTALNKDLRDVTSNFASDLKGSYSALDLLRQLDDDNFLDTNLAVLQSGIEQAQMMPTGTVITLTIEQDKKNLKLKFDEQAENAVSGGALSAVKNIYSLS